MKTNLLLALALTLAASASGGCAGHLRVDSSIDQVHRVALVSAYANKDVYNVEAPATGDAAALLRAALPSTDAGELERITSHALVATGDALAPSFELVDPATLVANPVYRALDEANAAPVTQEAQAKGLIGAMQTAAAQLGQGLVATPPGMVAIPVDTLVAPRGTMQVGDEKKAREAATARLGQLATDLDVDAVAVLQLDLAYKRSGFFTFSFLGTNHDKAKPSVATTLVMVDRNGEVVLDTPLLARGEGKRYLGKGVWMLKNGNVDLTQKSDKVVESFDGAVDAANASLEKALVKELGAQTAPE